MKSLINLLFISIFAISCVKQEPIPPAEMTGIWKLNGYQSSNYKVEITNDGYLYWWNYKDIFNYVEEFELEYDINRNEIRLFRPGGNIVRHRLSIYRQNRGGLYFSVPITGTDADGNTITNTDTYYKMN
jgi:hypothetical protein